MTIILSSPVDGIRQRQAHKLCTLWQLTRTDGTIIRLTNHDHPIEYSDGNTYNPMNGMVASSKESISGLQDSGFDVRGIMDSATISEDDLRAGLYRDCQIDEYLITWDVPWVGALRTWKYWINKTDRTEFVWRAEVSGWGRWLAAKEGRIITRECPYVVGQDKDTGGTPVGTCTFDTTLMKLLGKVVSTISTQRREFNTNITTVLDKTGSSIVNTNGWFSLGFIDWKSGANIGLRSPVINSFVTNARIRLLRPTPYDIAGSDAFDITPGCDGLAATCKTKFDNFTEFGGFPFVPGPEGAFVSASAQ